MESIILIIVNDDFKYNSLKWKWEEETEPSSPNSLNYAECKLDVSMKSCHHISHLILTSTLDGNISFIFIIRSETLSERIFMVIILYLANFKGELNYLFLVKHPELCLHVFNIRFGFLKGNHQWWEILKVESFEVFISTKWEAVVYNPRKPDFQNVCSPES